MTYLTREEFRGLGFDSVENFDQLLQRAEMTIDAYTRGLFTL